MTLIKGKNGIYHGLFRRAKPPMRALHVSMRTERKAVAKERHDAVQRVVREGRDTLIDQLRSGDISVERITAMVANQEPLAPIVAPVALAPVVENTVSLWETVDVAVGRYLKWLRQHPNLTARSKALAGFQLTPFQDFEYDGRRIGDYALDSVPSAAIMAYQQEMLDAARSPNSITVYMGRTSTLWSWALEHEQREAREARRAPRDLYSPIIPELLHRKLRPKERWLNTPEANLLLARTPPPLLWFVGCGLLAGLRAGETLHLRPGTDVDLDLGTISIREQGDWKPKTRRSKRIVPMAPSLLATAREHAARWANESWMMPSPVNAALPITDLGVRKHFKMIVEGAGLIYGRDDPRGVTYHTLRHSFAVHAVERGVDLYTVAKLLGDSLKMVEDVYADLSRDFKLAAVAKLAGAFTLPGFTETDTTSDTAEGTL